MFFDITYHFLFLHERGSNLKILLPKKATSYTENHLSQWRKGPKYRSLGHCLGCICFFFWFWNHPWNSRSVCQPVIQSCLDHCYFFFLFCPVCYECVENLPFFTGAHRQWRRDRFDGNQHISGLLATEAWCYLLWKYLCLAIKAESEFFVHEKLGFLEGEDIDVFNAFFEWRNILGIFGIYECRL